MGPIQIPLPLQKNISLPSDAPNGRTHRNVPWQEAGKEVAGLVLRICKGTHWGGMAAARCPCLVALGLCWHQVLLPWVQGGSSQGIHPPYTPCVAAAPVLVTVSSDEEESDSSETEREDDEGIVFVARATDEVLQGKTTPGRHASPSSAYGARLAWTGQEQSEWSTNGRAALLCGHGGTAEPPKWARSEGSPSVPGFERAGVVQYPPLSFLLHPQAAWTSAPAPASSRHHPPWQRRSCHGKETRLTWLFTSPRRPPKSCRWICRKHGTKASPPWRASPRRQASRQEHSTGGSPAPCWRSSRSQRARRRRSRSHVSSSPAIYPRAAGRRATAAPRARSSRSCSP